MCGYSCFQIELSRGYDYAAFHEDLKKLYQMAGVQNLDTVFLFTDTQIVVEGRTGCRRTNDSSFITHWVCVNSSITMHTLSGLLSI